MTTRLDTRPLFQRRHYQRIAEALATAKPALLRWPPPFGIASPAIGSLEISDATAPASAW